MNIGNNRYDNVRLEGKFKDVIRRLFIIAIELVAGLFGVAMLAFAILWWRLSTGPIPLDFATAYVERAASLEDSGIEVKIQDMALVWAGWDHAFDIRVDNATILGSGGKILATLPEVSVGFSVTALFDGLLALKRVEVEGLNATVERGKDGEFVLGFFSDAEPATDAEFAQAIPTFLALMSKPRNPQSSFGYLDVIRFSNVDIRYQDRTNNAVWHSAGSDIELLRGADGLEAVASMILDFGERSTELKAHALFSFERPVVDIGVEFAQLIPSDVTGRFIAMRSLPKVDQPFSGQFRVLAQLSGTVNSVAFDLKGLGGSIAGNVIVDSARELDMTLNLFGIRASALSMLVPQFAGMANFDTLIDARAAGRLGSLGEIRHLEFDAKTGAGTLALPHKLPQPLEFERIEFAGDVRDAFDTVNITEAKIDFGQPQLELSVFASRLGDNFRAHLDAEVSGLQMSELAQYWPETLASSAHAWTTTNILSGQVERGELALIVDVPIASPTEPEIRSMSGSLKYENIVVDYFNPFPKATGIGGSASFTNDRLDINVARGKLLDLDLDLDHGVINITRLDTDAEEIAIDLVLRGPLSTALVLADHEPFDLLGDVGIDPTAVEGEMAARLAFSFPLSKDLSLSEVTVSLAANMRGVGMSPGPFGLVLEKSDLELKLSNNTMKVAGQVMLNGVPLTLDWQEVFAEGQELRSRYILSGNVNSTAFERLGLPDIPVLSGDVEANVILTRFGDGRSEVLASGDLGQTVFSIPQISWLKPLGEPGKFQLGLLFATDGTPNIENFTVNAPGLEIAAQVDFEGHAWTAKFAKFKVDKTDLRGALIRRPDGGYLARIDGGSLDLEPILFGTGEEPREAEASPDGATPSVVIDAKFNSVRTGFESQFGLTEVQARSAGSDVDFLVFYAKLPDDKHLRASYIPDGAGHSLHVRSDDAGQALVALGWSDKLEGGTLVIEGKREVASEPLMGLFKLEGYKISNAPALARLLQVASLTGIFDALKRGLDFVSFDGKYLYSDAILQIEESRAYGSSIGFTLEGALDLEDDEVDFKGTVVPAYTVNRVLGQIPILGPILTGGKDEGLFAASYGVTGRLDDPAIAVNPLSALAPGFLRNLFDVIGSGREKAPDRNSQ